MARSSGRSRKSKASNPRSKSLRSKASKSPSKASAKRSGSKSPRRIPSHYVPTHLSDADRKRQLASIRQGTDRPKLDSFKSKRSKWVAEFERRFGHDLDDNGMVFIDKHLLAKKGIDQILDKGRAAYYTSGSRPNQTAESWARARLAAVIVGNAGTKKSGARPLHP